MSERFEYEVDSTYHPDDRKLLEGRGWNRWELVAVTINNRPNQTTSYSLFWKRTLIGET